MNGLIHWEITSTGFWRMPQKETYIRPYRDGIFFGQWFYAVQVGLHGLMYAAKTTGNMEHLRYYLDSIQTMADYFNYKDWDKEQFGDPYPDAQSLGTSRFGRLRYHRCFSD